MASGSDPKKQPQKPGKKQQTESGAPERPVEVSRSPVTLVKGGHTWTFSCDSGSEPELLRRLSELARGGDVPFDWFDAAIVSHQLNKRLKPGLFRIDGQEQRTEKR